MRHGIKNKISLPKIILTSNLIAYICFLSEFIDYYSSNVSVNSYTIKFIKNIRHHICAHNPLFGVKPLSQVKSTNLQHSQLLNKFSTTTPRKLSPCSSKRQFNNHEAIYIALHFSWARPQLRPFSNPFPTANEIIYSAR